MASTTAPPAATEAALAIVAGAAAETAAWPDDAPIWHPNRYAPLLPRFTRFRGDGWQFAAPLPFGPRAALFVTARLIAARGLQSRIALGLGAIDDWGPGPDLSAARGPALTASGRALDAMARGTRLTLAGTTDPRDPALFLLLTTLVARWSPEQAEAAAFALTRPALRQSEIAQRLGISTQAVSQRLKSGAVGVILESLAHWEQALDLETPFPPEIPR